MDTNDRPRKKIQEGGKAAGRRKSAVSRGVPAGSLKGRPLADEGRIGREKPSLAAARRTSSDAVVERLGPPRGRREPLTDRHRAIARADRSRLGLRQEAELVLHREFGLQRAAMAFRVR